MGDADNDLWMDAVKDEGYTIVKEIDYGAFSNVFKITQVCSGGTFALKKIQSSCPVEEDEYIFNEIQCLLKLRHRHIIQMKSLVLTEHVACIIMEYASLGNLQQYVKEQDLLSNNHVLNIFGQLLSATSYCHSCHIAHRDLNPSNVLLISSTFVKLGDFGQAFACNDDDGRPRLCNEYLGQGPYLAPEVLIGAPYDPKPSDVWSLGCALFFICFRDKPFSGSQKSILAKQLEQGFCVPAIPEVTRPTLFSSTMYDMCCVDVGDRHTIDCVSQQWLNYDMEDT
ncbi:NUAK family SNF1-like kinase 1 [Haliotis rubra]|uniref:NUAK family SNF1-like kinase 1 n=1 Tax=Haliotis rubra TaxID=36100 RepID=UPI001EE539C6|nr:NUAK family SNF1-like kinase 1 [Haliotis rubra]